MIGSMVDYAELITSGTIERLYRSLLYIRRVEEEVARIYPSDKIKSPVHLAIGQEAISVGVCEALRHDDVVGGTYRSHALYLAKGGDLGRMMAEMYGKVEGCSRGRGGSMHLFSAAHRFYGGYAIVGGGLPLAAGLALADRMQGQKRVTVCFFGEGAAAEGEFHETMNLSTLWKLPVLFVCENNLYAMGTRLDLSESETDIHAKAQAYRMPSEPVDGMDVVAVDAAANRAIAAIRDGAGPHFLECRTYRFRAHSMFDPQLYRTKEEVEEWKERDPIPRLANWMRQAGMLHDKDVEKIEADAKAEIDDAVAFAEAGKWEPVAELTRDVYAEAAS